MKLYEIPPLKNQTEDRLHVDDRIINRRAPFSTLLGKEFFEFRHQLGGSIFVVQLVTAALRALQGVHAVSEAAFSSPVP